MTLNRGTLFQLFKYAVYSLLAVNVCVFWREEHLASLVEFPGGIPAGQLINVFAATIDTAAWLVLLLMFELETYALDDRKFTRPVTLTLHGIRVVCYVFVVYACYGYGINVVDAYDVQPASGIADLCTLVGNGWSYAIDYDEYTAITSESCRELSSSGSFLRFNQHASIVDATGLGHYQLLAWADFINGLVWILIVVILEIEVRLQERDRLSAAAVRVFGAIKVLLYLALLLMAAYWGIDGDFVDFWDAFLWLVAFFFIEMNVIEWRADEEKAGETVTATQ